MQSKTITAEQVKQWEELGYLLVKVDTKWPNVWQTRMGNWFTGDKESIGPHFSLRCPFNLNDEVYCEDEQEEWAFLPPNKDNPVCMKVFWKDVLPKEKQEATKQFPSTMPTSLASKSWAVTGIEVVEEYPEDRMCKKCNGLGEIYFAHCQCNKCGGTGSKKKEWHWKIIMREEK